MEEALSFSKFQKRVQDKYQKDEKRIVGILFVRYGFGLANELLDDSFKYLDINTGKGLDIFLPGYGKYKYSSNDLECDEELIPLKNNKIGWFFNTEKYVDFKNEAQRIMNWQYEDEATLILTDYNNGKVDFSNIICINLERAVKSGSISTARSVLERITNIISNKGVYNAYALSNCLGKEYGKELILEFVSENIPMKIGKIGFKLNPFVTRKKR